MSRPRVNFAGLECELEIQRYAQPANICLRLFSPDEGPVATATVNPSILLAEGLVAIKNYSENFGVLAALEAAGVVERSGETIPVGYAEAEICHLLVE